jgi:hypothetical protein
LDQMIAESKDKPDQKNGNTEFFPPDENKN